MTEDGQKIDLDRRQLSDESSCRKSAGLEPMTAVATPLSGYIKRLAVVYPLAAVFQDDLFPNDQPTTAVRDASSGET